MTIELVELIDAFMAASQAREQVPIALALADVSARLHSIEQRITTMSGTITNIDTGLATLQTDVNNNSDVEASAITLLQGLSRQLAAALALAQQAGGTPQQLAGFQQLHTALTSKSSELAQAVANNTPAASTDGAAAGTAGTGQTATLVNTGAADTGTSTSTEGTAVADPQVQTAG